MDARRGLRGARALVVGGAVLIALSVVPAGATAVDWEYDQVSDFSLTAACMTGDQIGTYVRFHLEAGADTPEAGRIMSAVGTNAYHGLDEERYEFQVLRSEGVPYFPLDENVSGDHEIDLARSVMRSVLEQDHLTVTLYYGDGTVAATDSVVVDCFNEGGDTEVSDIDVTVRATVPTKIRLREYVRLSGVDAAGDTPRQAWVVSPGIAWDADGRGDDTLDDLVLEPAVQSALGATLADQVLTLDATTAGVYTLEWGIVTTPIDSGEWTGGYGDRHGPAALRINVIDQPILPAESALTEDARGSVAAPDAVAVGSAAQLDLGDAAGGEYVDVWLHSEPLYLGLMQVPADGKLPIVVPVSLAAGEHRVIVTDPIGNLVGWDDTTVTRPGTSGGTGSTSNRVPRGATGLDEAPTSPLVAPVVAVLVAAGGAAAFAGYRLERRRAR